jgi:signal transduction histidine kinase
MTKKNLLLIFLCFLLHHVLAQEINWTASQPAVDITRSVQVLEDPGGALSFEQIQSPRHQNSFRPSNKAVLNFGFTTSVHWLRFTINNTAAENAVLEVAHAFLPETSLYYKDAAGKTVVIRAGYKIPISQKVVRHHFQVFPLVPGVQTYYIRLVSNSHPIRVSVYKESAFDVKTYQQRLVYGFYIGFMVFVILSNLFFYASLRNKLYLFYAGIVVVYISYASAVMDGFILYFIPHIDLMFWYVTIPTIGVPLQMIYALVFLDVKKYNPKLHKVITWLIVYFFVYLAIKFWLPLTTVLAINTVHALVSFFIMGYLGYVTGRKGNRLGYYFALAYFIYFLLVLTEATYIQIGKPRYLFELSHVALATLIEAFLLSFLLSKRFEFEKEETERSRRDAQNQLLEKTLENERIVKEQNLTLEKRVEERTKALNDSVENLKQTQDRLIQSEKLASLGELTAGIAHEIQNPLNFINNFSEMNVDIVHDLQAAQQKQPRDAAYEAELFSDIKQNAEKIVHHGRRADAIVKGMLQHSRKATGQKEETDINLMCDEYLRLSYHGLRAKDKSFNAIIKTEFDNNTGKIPVVPQDMGRVFLNLFNNAFYAVHEQSKKETEAYKPAVMVRSKRLPHKLEITVTDNGMGISKSLKDKIFQPFFTTKPAGQGTGLGLSLSYDIVKAHGGELSVDSIEGEGTSFTITLPL